MGDWKRTVGFAVAIVAIGVSLLLPWWQIGEDGSSISIGLREIELCMMNQCTELEPGGAYGVISTFTFFYGIAALFGLIFGGLLPALADQPTRGGAVAGAIAYILFAGMTIWTLPEEITTLMVAERTFGYWCALGGPIAAIAGMIASSVSRSGAGQGKPILYRPPGVDELKKMTGGAPAPAPAPAPARTKPPSMPSVHFAPVPGVPPAPTVPRALASVEIHDDMVIGVDRDGRRREVRWDEIGAALARELRDDPPFVDTVMVDLIPAGAPPLRVVAATRITIATGAPASPDPRERLRRLLVFARAMNPTIELEGATEELVATEAALPDWSLDDLARYDVRYG